MSLLDIPANPVPAGAVTGQLETADGVRVRYARWAPLAPRRGTVCVLPGRADMIEKYFEVVGELRERGFAVAVLDWRGQGGSQRLLPDPRKGHVRRFEDYQLDLEVLMREVVLPDCPPPIFALAHSMGAAVLIEAVHQGRRWFDRIVLTSPMIALRGFSMSRTARAVVRAGAWIGFGHSYIPGGGPVAVTNRPFHNNPVTSDPVRYERGAAIVQAKPDLGLGSPTIGWTYAAYRVIDAFADPTYPSSLRQPLLLMAAGDDRIVSSPASERFAFRLHAGARLVINGSRHEILMERDAIRDQFWAAFDAFVPGSPPVTGSALYR
jgi:lysophospholipase